MFKMLLPGQGKITIKTIVIICILLVSFFFIAREAINYRYYLDSRKEIIVIEGANPEKSNFASGPGYIRRNFKLLGGQALHLSTPDEKEGGYFAEYEFKVPKDGIYDIYIAGTPPGPFQEGAAWHSPYTVSVDSKNKKELTEEALRDEWPQFLRHNYVQGGYYFTKVMTVPLSKGEHNISILIDKRRKYEDKHFTIYIDAIIVAPKGFKPQTDIGGIPKEVFN